MTTTEHPIVFPESPVKQAHYEVMVEQGQSPRMAEMLAARKAPALKGSDANFMAGRWNGGINDPEMAAIYRQRALAAGVNPNGKTYCGQLAAFPGDPAAWVDSLSDVKRRADALGLKIEGSIDYTPPGWEEPAGDDNVEFSSDDYEVSDDIVMEEMESAALDNPDVAETWLNDPQAFMDAKEKAKAVFSGKV